DDLPNEDINNKFVAELAEAKIKRRVPNFKEITDPEELMYLQNAVISQICAILCPSMARRLNLKIAISDVRIDKDKVDWEEMRQKFLTEVEESLTQIQSVSVDITSISKFVDKITHERQPIGF
ncbi:MAG: hypothetical protein QXI16_02705, partial [Sulfolobaceae archaeon]